MESLSDNLKGKLRAFIDAWTQERYIDEEVQITSSQVIFRRPTETLYLDLNELLNFHDPNEKKTLLERCKEDLNRAGTITVDYCHGKIRSRYAADLNADGTIDVSNVPNAPNIVNVSNIPNVLNVSNIPNASKVSKVANVPNVQHIE